MTSLILPGAKIETTFDPKNVECEKLSFEFLLNTKIYIRRLPAV